MKAIYAHLINGCRNTSFSKGQTTKFERCDVPLWSALVGLGLGYISGTAP